MMSVPKLGMKNAALGLRGIKSTTTSPTQQSLELVDDVETRNVRNPPPKNVFFFG